MSGAFFDVIYIYEQYEMVLPATIKYKNLFDDLWKNFWYSLTKDPKCMLSNKELFERFKAKIQGELLRIEGVEPF